jgi:hypothetical protein
MSETLRPTNVLETDYLRLNDGHTRVRAEVPTLENEIRVRILEQDGAELVIPMRVAMSLNPKLFPPIAQTIWPWQNRARRQLHHPMKYSSLLIMDPSDPDENTFRLPPEFSSEFGVPVIHWNESGMSAASQVNGWQLSLSAFAWLNLGFADWQDEESIKALVVAMMDVESLNIMAAILSPESARAINSPKRGDERDNRS